MEVPATAGHKRKGATEDGDTPAVKKATKITTQVQGPLNVSPELADSTNGERSLETNARRNDPLAVSPELDDSMSNKRASNGIPKKPKWFVEQQVFVKLVDSSWVLGQIVDVKEKGTTIDGTFYDYAVCVQAEKEDGSDVHLELPKSSIAKRLRGYDEFLYSLPPDQQLHLRCMRANKSKRSAKRVPSRAADDSKAGEKGPSLDDILLGDVDPTLSLKEQIQRLKQLPEVAQTVALATGKPDRELSATVVLAYLVGQLAGCELQQLSTSKDEEQRKTGKWILDGLAHNSSTNVEQLQAFDCDLTKVFLTSASMTRTKKGKKFDPQRALFDSRVNKRFEGDDELEKAVGKVTTSLMSLHASQSRDTQLSGPGAAAIFRGISLLLDGKGVTESLISEFSKAGMSAPAKLLRTALKLAAAAMESHDVRSPPPEGMVPAFAVAMDNADYHVFASVISVVPLGDMLLYYENEKDAKHFHDTFVDGLPIPTEEMAKGVAPTAKDDEVAKETIMRQNVLALINAARLSVCNVTEKVADNASEWSEGDVVHFTHHHIGRVGTIVGVDGDDLRVSYNEANGENNIAIVRSGNARPPPVETPSSEGEQSEQNASDNVVDLSQFDVDEDEWEQFRDAFVPGVDDGGGRHKEEICTAIIREVLDGLSSKHNETASMVLDRILKRYSGVITLIADQEFMPTFYREFFASLLTENRIPLLLQLAMAHGLKALGTTQFQYFASVLDPIFKAQGIMVGSPAYNRIVNGRVIRDTLRWLCCASQGLRTTFGRKFLDEKGCAKVVCNPDTKVLESPYHVLERYFCAFQDETHYELEHEAVTVIDQHMRPQVILLTKPLVELARVFEAWTAEIGGESGGYYVGPSGYVRGPKDAPTDNSNSEPVRDVVIEPAYQWILQIPYYGEDGEDGLYQLCKKAEIVTKDQSRKKEFLQKRYYLYRKTSDEGSEAQGRAAANAYVEEQSRKVPDGCRPFGTAMSQFLNGPVAFAMIEGLHICRVMEREDEHERCSICRKSTKNCRCMSNNRVMVFMKAFTCAVSSHNNINYQRLAVNNLLCMKMILAHPDQRCCRMAMKRLRRCLAMNESGDSFVMQAGDLVYEERLVGTTKKHGRRDPNTITSLEPRVKVASGMIANKVEEKAKTIELKGLPPYRPTQKKQEARTFLINVTAFEPLVDKLVSQKNDGNVDALSIPTTDFVVNCKVRLVFKALDAFEFVTETAVAFARGYQSGIEVSLPQRESKPLSAAHKPAGAIVGNKSSKTEAVERSKLLAKEAQEVARDANFVMVPSNHDMFSELSKAGQGKASMLKSILQLLGTNNPFEWSQGMLGRGPSCPILLSTSRTEMRQKMQSRLGPGAPIIVFSDVMQHIQTLPPRRAGGKFELTITELARDIITMLLQKYHRRGVSLIVACMDVNSRTSTLRKIAHAKRKKVQSTQTQYNAVASIRSPNDPLSSLGSYPELVRSAKDTLLPYVADEIVNQINSDDKPDEDWEPSKMFKNVTLGFIGGSTSACTFMGPLNVRVSSCCLLDRRSLQSTMATVIDQGEGERMIFASIHRLLSMGFQATNSPLDCFLDIDCADTDSFAGMSAQLAHSLDSALRNEGKHFAGSILIQGHSKSVRQIMEIGKSFLGSLGIADDCLPTGNGFSFQIDVIALFYRLEQLSKMAPLPRGHRAVSATAATYALVCNDYNAIAGIGYSDVLNALCSKELKKAIEARAGNLGRQECTPIVLEPASFSSVESNMENKSGFNLSGALLCIAIVAMNMRSTRRLLARRYPPSDLVSFFPDRIPYNVIRAASLLSGEKVQAPDPIALLARLSCSDFVLRQWLVCPYQETIAPAVGPNELDQTAYNIPEKIGKGRECSVMYSLLSLSKMICALEENDYDSLRDMLQKNVYGNIFRHDQLQRGRRWVFRPLHEVLKVRSTKGLYPSIRVPTNLVLPTFQADTMGEVRAFVNRYKPLLSIESDKKHGAACLQSVFELTICSRTAYNPDKCGLGSPLLVSRSAIDASTGGFKDQRRRWSKKVQWSSPQVTELASLSMRDIFSRLDSNDSDNLLKVCSELCGYIFAHSTTPPSAAAASRRSALDMASSLELTLLDDSESEEEEEERAVDDDNAMEIDDSGIENKQKDDNDDDDESIQVEFCDGD